MNGETPENIHFQVCLPTPLIVVGLCIHCAFHRAVEPIYRAAIARALRRIQTEIPALDLAIQWDMPGEIAMFEKVMISPWFTPLRDGITERMVRLAVAVDDGVELGFHLCYGDHSHRHFVQPKDTTISVDLCKYQS
jgi:hypothetical protein